MHEFNAREDRLRYSERFESEQRPGNAFDRTAILLDNIVEIQNHIAWKSRLFGIQYGYWLAFKSRSLSHADTHPAQRDRTLCLLHQS